MNHQNFDTMKSFRNNTYTQIHIHVVFAVKKRESLIQDSWKNRLYDYISGIIQNRTHKLLAIGGVSDHIHLLIGMRPTQSLSDLIGDVKGCSSIWINEQRLSNGWFAWQEGYGAFSYAKEELPDVINYIIRQHEHHKQESMVNEYKKILDENGVEYDERNIFKEVK